jgi:hypothetical protein
MLKLRRLVLDDEGGWRANPKELLLLQYYANSIAHLLAEAPESSAVVAWPRAAALQRARA